MKYKGINLNIVIIVIILVISIFFVGKYLLKLYNVEQPLFEKINAIEEVKEVKIVNGKEKIDIYLNLMSGVELYSLYQKVENVIKEEIEIDKSNILINNSSELEDIYYKIHFAIYEGIATNDFSDMKKNIDLIMQDEGFDYRIWVDDNYVYLQLNNEKNDFYRVFDRLRGDNIA